MSVKHVSAAALAVALLGLSGCVMEDGFGGFQRYSRDFHYSYPLKSDGRLSVETFNGSVEISGWDEATIDISGTKYGPSQEAADALRVDVDHASDAVSVRAVRPTMWRNNIGARFVIKVPRGAALERIISSNGAIRVSDENGPAHLRTSNGQIHVEAFHGNVDAQTSNSAIELVDVDGDVTAHTSNGHVRADNLRGSLQATTSNGGVKATLSRPDRPVHVETSNGSVELTLPPKQSADVRVHSSNNGITLRLAEPVNARVSAHTTNASIHCGFEVRMSGEIGKNHMDAVIGAGGPLFDLSTSNGGIRLVKM